MKKNLLACLSFLLVLQVNAQTNVQGLITGNVTWTKANSPYIVTGHLLVDTFAKLTIEPGVEVRVGSNFNFFVSGEFDAVGSATDPIKFTSSLSNPAIGSWKGIEFKMAKQTDTIQIHYCHVEYAKDFLRANDRNLSIVGCDFSNIQLVAMLQGGQFVVADNTINNCGAIALGSMNGEVARNKFSHPIYPQKSLYINGVYKLIDNYFAYGGGFGTSNGEILEATGNKFYHNAMADLGNNLTIHKFSSNVFAYNDLAMYIRQPVGVISYNTFKHNKVAINFDHGWDKTRLEHNCFDSISDYFIKFDFTGDNIDCSNNYWGTTDSAVIRSKMHDYYIDFVNAKVMYMPVATTAGQSCQSVPSLTVNDAQKNAIAINVYPNPFSSSFSIASAGTSIVRVVVYNLFGEKILSADGAKKEKVKVKMTQYPPGQYI